jgi:hypothetical protein
MSTSGAHLHDAGGFIRQLIRRQQTVRHGRQEDAVLKGMTTESRLNAALQRRLVNSTVVPVDR